MNMQRIYPSKVLLFGEYTVLHHTQALAIPYPGLYGQWTRKGKPSAGYAEYFRSYVQWLRAPGRIEEQGEILDIQRMEADFDDHWVYDSIIPEGYGLGSSGALCAALFDRYALDPDVTENGALLRQALANLESFFHGKSSGIDPFVSLVNRPVLRQRNGSLQLLDPVVPPGNWAVCLVDSGISRETSAWVSVYEEKCTDSGFRQSVERRLIPDVEHAIHFILGGAWELAWPHIEKVSDFQEKHFREMIPAGMHELWTACRQTSNCRMKLCGAGGGGYFLFFSKDEYEADKLLGKHPFIRIRERG